MLPATQLKLLLLDAQIALSAGRAALAKAEPLLHLRAPRPASWWHLLSSRLELLEGRHRQALTHARLALRLGTESQLPERWMGVTVIEAPFVREVIAERAPVGRYPPGRGRSARKARRWI